MTAEIKNQAEEQLQNYAHLLENTKSEIAKIVIGQDSVINQTLISLIAGGHVLLIGVPGLAKTLLTDTIGKVMGLTSGRVQCTPDLMPGDITGSEILEEDENGKRSFRFIKGPVFNNILMMDEINRASPRTQSALLQAMQEQQVSVAGKNHKIPQPFHVLATQNPIEQEGTYPLPEAQLDRFLMEIHVDYPELEDERSIMLSTTSNTQPSVDAVLSKKDFTDIQHFLRDMPVGKQVADAVLKLVRGARPGENAPDIVKDYVSWAPGPRASQALLLAIKASALLDGRATPSLDDIKALALPVLRHRMALHYRAQADNVDIETVIKALTEKL